MPHAYNAQSEFALITPYRFGEHGGKYLTDKDGNKIKNPTHAAAVAGDPLKGHSRPQSPCTDQAVGHGDTGNGAAVSLIAAR